MSKTRHQCLDSCWNDPVSRQNASAPQTSIPMAIGGNPDPDTRDPTGENESLHDFKDGKFLII